MTALATRWTGGIALRLQSRAPIFHCARQARPLMSHVSENKNLKLVFKTLFSPAGSEIYTRPMTDYGLAEN
jgi:hypothetical protein